MGQRGHLQQPGHLGQQGSQHPLRRTPPAGPTGRSLPATSRENSIPPARGGPALQPLTDTPAGLVTPASSRRPRHAGLVTPASSRRPRHVGRKCRSSRGHSRPGVSPAMVPSTNTTEIREGTDRGSSTDNVGAFVTSTGKSPLATTEAGNAPPPPHTATACRHPSLSNNRHCPSPWIMGSNITTDPGGEHLPPDQSPFFRPPSPPGVGS